MDSPRNSGLVSHSLLNLGGHVVPMVVAAVSFPIILSAYSLEQFALLSLSWSFLGAFAYFDLGLGRATVRAIAGLASGGDERTMRGVFWGSMVVSMGAGIIGAFAMFFGARFLVAHILTIAPEWSEEAVVVFALTGMAFPAVTSISVLRGLLEALQRFDLVNAIKAPANALIFLIPLAGALLSWSLQTVVLMSVFSRFLALLAYTIAAVRIAGPAVSWKGISWTGLPELLRFGGWVTVTNVATPVIASSDRLVLAALVPLEHVAFYLGPYELISRLPVFASSVAQALFPIMSRTSIAGRNVEAVGLLGDVSRTVAVVMIPLIVLIIGFAPEGLNFWLGSVWTVQSTGILQILTAAFFFNALSNVYLAGVHGSGRADLKAKLDVVVALLTVALCWLFVVLFGLNGAAIARLVLLATDLVVLVVFVKIISGLPWQQTVPASLRVVGVAGLVLSIAAWALSMHLSDPVIRLIVLGLMLVLVGPLLLRGDSNSKKISISSFLNRMTLKNNQ